MTNTTPPENVINAFVAAANAGDVELMDEVVDSEIDGPFFSGTGTPGERFLDAKLRSPWSVLSRAEVGHQPVAAVWSPDTAERYHAVGYLEFAIEDDRIIDVTMIESMPDDFVAEEPDPAWVTVQPFEELDGDDLVAGT